MTKRKTKAIGKYTIHTNITKKMWAIIIMPDEIRVDNAHNFVHIHFSNKGKHHQINEKEFNTVYNIIEKHIITNKTINKEKLMDELL